MFVKSRFFSHTSWLILMKVVTIGFYKMLIDKTTSHASLKSFHRVNPIACGGGGQTGPHEG